MPQNVRHIWGHFLWTNEPSSVYKQKFQQFVLLHKDESPFGRQQGAFVAQKVPFEIGYYFSSSMVFKA